MRSEKTYYRRRNKHYLVQQPERLESLTIVKVGEMLARHVTKLAFPISRLFDRNKTKAETLFKKQTKAIRNYLISGVPKEYYNDLLNETARPLTFEKTITCLKSPKMYLAPHLIAVCMIEIVFTESLTYLDIRKHKLKAFEHVFYAKSYLLTGLTHLKLDNLMGYRAVDSKPITKGIKKLSNLKYLSFNGKHIDDVLKTIAKYCNCIEELDLERANLSDKNINIIIRLPHLKRINLCNTSVNEKQIEIILMYCMNIECIDIEERKINFIKLALENIISKSNSIKTFKLKYYSCGYDRVGEEVGSEIYKIIKICPLIEKLCLQVYDTLQNYFTKLRELSYLQELELSFKDSNIDILNIKGIETIKMYRLVSLKLINMARINTSVLLNICGCFPNLQTLRVTYCTFVEEKLDINKTEVSENATMKTLKNLSFSSSRLCGDQFIFLLWHCPNVEFISLGVFSICLTDDILLKVLDKNALKYLKELNMYSCNLTSLVVDRITENCINNPNIFLDGIQYSM